MDKEERNKILFGVFVIILLASAIIPFCLMFKNIGNQQPIEYFTYEGKAELYNEINGFTAQMVYDFFYNHNYKTVFCEYSKYYFLLITHNETLNCTYYVEASAGLIGDYFYHYFDFPDGESITIYGYFDNEYFKVKHLEINDGIPLCIFSLHNFYKQLKGCNFNEHSYIKGE